MNNDDYLKELAYEPYIKEIKDELLSILETFAVIIIAFIIISPSFLVLIFPFILACIGVLVLLSIKDGVLCILERKKVNYITTELKLINIKQEKYLLGLYKPGFKNAFSYIYDEELHMNRYIVTCITSDRELVKLRCAINATNSQILYDNIEKPGGWTRTVTYGKYSKIIVDYNDKDYEALVLRRRYNSYDPDKQDKRVNNKKVRKNHKRAIVAISHEKKGYVTNKNNILKLLLDEGIVLVFFLVIAILAGPFIVKITGINTTVVISIALFMIVLLMILYCKELLLLPIDILYGEQKERCYFLYSEYKYTGMTNRKISKYKYSFLSNTMFSTTLIASLSEIMSNTDLYPPKEVQVELRYYQFSKILLEWKIVKQQ